MKDINSGRKFRINEKARLWYKKICYMPKYLVNYNARIGTITKFVKDTALVHPENKYEITFDDGYKFCIRSRYLIRIEDPYGDLIKEQNKKIMDLKTEIVAGKKSSKFSVILKNDKNVVISKKDIKIKNEEFEEFLHYMNNAIIKSMTFYGIFLVNFDKRKK